jgi:hypothetical protein
MKRIITLVIVLGLAGCTDASKSRIASYGESGTVVCYSGGTKIYEGKSTGKIEANSNLAGVEFREIGTNRFVRTTADCMVFN